MRINWEKYGIQAPHGYSGNKKVLCPQCHDQRRDKRDKSLSINLKTGEFNCHYCGFSGCAAEKEEWEKERPWQNYAPIRKQKPEYKKPSPRPQAAISDKALAWFKGRGISAATLSALKITEGSEWMPQKEGQANTVQFNYYHKGELINTKFRTGDKCFKLVSGAELIPYNIDAIKDTPECIITEGEMDALSFYECGRHDVISVPNGANANLDYLDDFIEEYFDGKETIYIASDTDTKGVILRDELLRRFGAERCRVLEYGEGCKDANEHFLKYGRDSLLQCIANAPEIKLEGIFTVSDFEPSLDALFEHGMQKGVTIGHENFDRLLSFETKRLCVVTGIPGSGKSEFIDEIAERLNMRYGWRFAYFSPENAPLAYHASKLIEKFTGKHFDKQHLTFGEYKQVKQHLETDFFFIAPKDDYRLDTILERAKFLVRRKGIKALVIDPYNRLEDESEGQNETKYISKMLDRLTNFAQQNDVLIILMAHPTKMAKNKDGAIEAPTLYDISGSAHFNNKADFGIVVHRNRIENTVEVHVQKVKFKHLGECGTALFKYNLNNGRYSPHTNGKDPVWDNSNHLQEEQKRREQDAAEAATFDWDNMQPTDEECPF
ncbi:DnaB-like helicase C-terminal domain-containing protein [Bacteroides sp.]|uniref:DnaB-like helicase C-terminal domain-containing protein n=1 Tax=Bacteroides sp. TaxID=29523 RepID=UPI002A82DE58|nr:DnaB-like helicase C-terminal domain-containing protein [Bacteroides sp.]